MSRFLTKLMQTGQFTFEEGHIRMLGEYVLLFPSGVVVHMYDVLLKKLGRKKTGKLLEEMGRYQVEAAAKRYLKRYSFSELSKSKIMDFTTKILNSTGWGMIEVSRMSMKNRSAQVIVRESTLPTKWLMLHKNNSKKPIDFWLKGLIKEHFTVIFGSKVKVVESKCIACGDKYCAFDVSKA